VRVAVIHNLRPGGARRRLAEQLAHLGDVDVVEVCLSTAAPLTADPVLVAMTPRAPLAARALRAPLRHADLVRLFAAWQTVAAEVRRSHADVVLANPCQMLQAPASLPAVGVPSLYFCDEPRRADYDEDARQMRNPWTAAPYWPLHRAERLLDRRAVRAATRIATNSKFTASRIRLAYGRDATVLSMGVPDAMLAAVAGDPAPSHVLSVGSLIASKGHELVLRGVAATANARPVVIVTPRDEPPEHARLTSIARELGVELQIRVGVSDVELTALYGGAFATCYLARGEPLGLVSLEAQACGCPVVVADEGGLPETVRPGITGIVVELRARAVADALDALEDPAARERFARAAQTWGREHSWVRSAGQVRGMLDELIGVADGHQ
jgi:glycosyltransferase involved in cell wall biosynthesis